jgi:anaerobic selenocysteine-containing dehydrogenase
MDEFVTACPRNCYSTCSFRVEVENNRVRRILPFSGNLSTPEGPCIKGLSYLERTYSPDRIIYPLIKSSGGKFHKIPTAEAHDIISFRLEDIRQKYGPHSILWYTGSGMSGLTNETSYSFWEAFGGVTRTYGNLCWPAGLEAVRLTLGSVKHNVPWDLENARTIVIWGKNSAETNIQEIAFINRAKEKGARVIVIDPVRTPTADKADVLYSIKSGTDAALALAMARVIINDNLTDLIFIKENVYGFEEFSRSLNIGTEEAAVITGIPSQNIIELAHIIAKEGPVTIIPGYGLQRHLNGGQTIRSVLALSVLTGNIGKPGAGFNYANLQSYIYDTIKEPVSYYPDKIRDLTFRRTISMAKLGTDMLNTTAPELKAAWIERGNPLLQSPDTNNVKKAFGKLDFIVVAEQFMTDTAAIADIILPAKGLFEYSDIIGSYWSPYVQFKPKVIEPPGEVMAESEVYRSLAKKLKLNISSELLPEPGNDNIELWLADRIKDYSELTLNDLKKGPVLAPGLQKIAYEDLKFDTPSGKIELLSHGAESRWGIAPLPSFVNPHLNINRQKFPLIFVTPNTGSRIHSQFGNLKVIKETVPEPAAEISPADAACRNISTGDSVRIFNNNGEIVSKVRVSNRIPAGTVVLPNGIWYAEGGGGNHLTVALETDIGHGAAFHDNMVEMERVEKHG